MRRFATLAIIVVVVAGLVAGAYLKFVAQPAAAAGSTANLATATVQQGTLTATVSASGNVTARQDVALSFGQTGTVQKVNVQIGDQVKAGQVLAQLDTTDLTLAVQNAQVNLKVAQDKLAQAKNPNTQQDINTARAQLDAAQAAYQKLATPTASDVSAAQAAVASAQAAYNAAVSTAGTSSNSLSAAADALVKAQAAVQQAQAAYDKVKSAPDIGARPESVNLQNATADYNQAKANYDSLTATSKTSNASTVQQAVSNLQQAKANLTKLTNPNPSDLQSAQDSVTQAKNNLEKLLAGSDANTLDIAQNGVDTAQIALQQAQAALAKAQILAPFDGVVTAVNVSAGQNAPSGSTGAVEVADLGHLQVVVNLAEVDVAKIKPGQDAQISLDALPNATLDGKVTQVYPAGVSSQGVVNYPVVVALANPDPSVKTGMSASVNIVVDQRDNVLMVPNRAIRNVGGRKLATVLFEGQQIQVPVQTGLSNDTNTEVTSGLKEGDTVVLSTTTTTQPQFRGGPGLGGPGGFGGPGR